MKKLAAIVALLMLTTALPVATAFHLSAGVQTAPRTTIETPENPSVPGKTTGTTDTPFGIGTMSPDQCEEVTGELSPDNVAKAATLEGFCSDLYYNEDFDLQHTSPVLQDQNFLTDAITTFDVQRSNDASAPFLPTCLVYCKDDPNGDPAWEVVHTAGQAAGVTDGPQDADDEENDNRDQSIRSDVDLPTATTFAQRNLGVWEMNGWTTPYPLEHWVAFVEGPQGSGPGGAITPTDLQQIMAAEGLPSDTLGGVCGFTPDASFIGTASSAGCEFNFQYVGPHPDDDHDEDEQDFDNYEHQCENPSYICAPQHGAYWRSVFVGTAGAYGGSTQTDEWVAHWMIGPNPPDCEAAEPNFDLDGDGTGLPFLAHDLDVYTPVTEVSNSPADVSVEGPDDLSDELTDLEIEGVNVIPLLEETATQTPVVQADSTEPSFADPSAPIQENSRSAISQDRGEPTDCLLRVIAGPGEVDDASSLDPETTDTRDPWVNLVDAHAEGQGDIAQKGAPFLGTDSDLFLRADLYGSDSGDGTNRPGPGVYSTTGQTGVFADKDDDGFYDQLVGPADAPSGFGQEVWNPIDIAEAGAYPMVWDVHVKEGQVDNAQFDPSAGCILADDTTLTASADNAGYGPNTGLVQAIYLREPTAFYDTDSPRTASPYPAGNNLFVLPSNAGHELWDGDVTADAGNAMDQKVDDFVADLQNYADDLNGDLPEPTVQRPIRDLGLDSAFFGQCAESTGGFDSQVSFLHHCPDEAADTPVSCEGDTIATMYTYEVTSDAPDDTLGADKVPPLKYTPPGTEQRIKLDFNSDSWFDLDAFDNDPSRTSDAQQPAH